MRHKGRRVKTIKIQLVEFQSEPFAAVVLRGEEYVKYDLAYSKRDRRLYAVEYGNDWQPFTLEHRASRWWARKNVRVTHKLNRLRRKRLPSRWPLRLIEQAILNDEVDRFLYCSACKDFMPSEDLSGCSHIAWCYKHGMWNTPDERCCELSPVLLHG